MASVSPLNRWNDDRLDDLKRRLDSMEPTVQVVGRLEERMDGLSRELRANGEGQREVAKRLEGLTLEPLARGRQVRSQLFIAISAALVGGGIAVLSAVLGGH